jgi:predicted small secreted protein
MNSRIKSLLFLLLGAALFAFVGTGCNTANGVGKDVEKLGDKIQDKSGK